MQSVQPTETPPRLIDQVIELLRLTEDGGTLGASDLALVQVVANGGDEALTPAGRQHWDALLQDARNGARGGLARPWLHGVANLTMGPDGYVYWRGVEVEHYSHSERLRSQAIELGEICKLIESRGGVVGSVSVGRVYDEIHFATSMDTPKFRFFWSASRDQEPVAGLYGGEHQWERARPDLGLYPNVQALAEQWGVPEWSVRWVCLSTQDDLTSALQTVDSSVRWLADVGRANAIRCEQAREILLAPLRRTFAPPVGAGTVQLPTRSQAAEAVFSSAGATDDREQGPRALLERQAA